MTKPYRFAAEPKTVRDTLNEATLLADEILELEKKLVYILYRIDENRFYIRYGFKSLMGFCTEGLKFTKSQSQRLVTNVRRSEPMSSMGVEAQMNMIN